MRGCKMLCELLESIRTVTRRFWMRPVNLRVCGDRFPFRVWGERWKWIMSSVCIGYRVSSVESKVQSVLSRSNKNLELEHLWS